MKGAGSIAAIVLETITGSNGVIIPPERLSAGRTRAVRSDTAS